MSERLYRLLVRLYPEAFRRRYERQMIEAFVARHRTRTGGLVRFWAFHTRDFVISLVREHADQWRRYLRARHWIPFKERLVSTLLPDLKYAVRSLRDKPGFATIVVLTLGPGIGLNTAIFSVVNGVLLRPLPYDHSERLVWGYSTFSGGNNASVSPPDYLDYRAENTVFEYLAGRRGPSSHALTGTGAPRQVTGQMVTAGFFEALGGRPVVGRTFTTSDETEATGRVVVLSHGFWQRMFGGTEDVLRQTLTLDGVTYDIVGVMPPGFRLFNSVDFWTPVPFDNEFAMIRRFHNLRLVGQLRPGVSLESAQAELDLISRRLEVAYPESNATWRLVITPLQETLVGSVRPALMVLLGAVGLVLLIACGNVANLLLARGATRQTELGVRVALGASRGRVIQQLLTESVVLALIGGGIGVGFAFAGVEVLRNLDPQNLPRLDEVVIDWRVLSFALIVSATTGLIFGVLPALTSSKVDVQSTLSHGGRSGGSGGGRARAALVATEVALSLILLVGSGLLIRSFWHLNRVEPGFEADNLVAATVSLPRARYETPEQRIAFLETLRERLNTMPGVEDLGWTNILPLGGSGNDTYLAVAGKHQLGTDSQFNAQTRVVSENYFEVMGIPSLRGRAFTVFDGAGSPPVVIIDEPFANTIFPDEDPIGQRLQIDFGEVYEAEIVGVVGGVNHFSLAGARPMQFYVPYRQDAGLSHDLVVRTSVDPDAVMAIIPRVVSEIDSQQPVAGMTTLAQLIGQSVAQPRFQMLLLGVFGVAALILAAVGIYGVLGYYVAQRTREVGLRMALGAKRRDVYGLVVGRGLVLTAIGLVAGLFGAVVLTRFMSSLLFGVAPNDPLTLIVVPGVLGLVAFVASYLPARRAARIDPMVALRNEV